MSIKSDKSPDSQNALDKLETPDDLSRATTNASTVTLYTLNAATKVKRSLQARNISKKRLIIFATKLIGDTTNLISHLNRIQNEISPSVTVIEAIRKASRNLEEVRNQSIQATHNNEIVHDVFRKQLSMLITSVEELCNLVIESIHKTDKDDQVDERFKAIANYEDIQQSHFLTAKDSNSSIIGSVKPQAGTERDQKPDQQPRQTPSILVSESKFKFYQRKPFRIWVGALATLVILIGIYRLGLFDKLHVVPPGLDNKSRYTRNSKSSEISSVIVFVHGVTGNGTDTWTNTTPKKHTYWPELLETDETFNNSDIYVYDYPSPWFKTSLSIDELAENLRLILENGSVLKYKEIIFICHSMGGLVVREYILKYRHSIKDKIRMIYFFGTPTTGSEVALLGKYLSDNPQFRKMAPMNWDGDLGNLQRNWRAAEELKHIKTFCGYETIPLFGLTLIVKQDSASSLCSERLDPIPANHIDIVKPAGTNSTPYIAFRTAYLKMRELDQR